MPLLLLTVQSLLRNRDQTQNLARELLPDALPVHIGPLRDLADLEVANKGKALHLFQDVLAATTKSSTHRHIAMSFSLAVRAILLQSTLVMMFAPKGDRGHPCGRPRSGCHSSPRPPAANLHHLPPEAAAAQVAATFSSPPASSMSISASLLNEPLQELPVDRVEELLEVHSEAPNLLISALTL